MSNSRTKKTHNHSFDSVLLQQTDIPPLHNYDATIKERCNVSVDSFNKKIFNLDQNKPERKAENVYELFKTLVQSLREDSEVKQNIAFENYKSCAKFRLDLDNKKGSVRSKKFTHVMRGPKNKNITQMIFEIIHLI